MLIALGCATTVVSAFLPWVQARSRSQTLSFAPATQPELVIGSWIVLAALIAGAVAFVVSRSVGVMACAAAIWFNASLLWWLFGTRVATLLPAEVLPDNLTASVQAGAAVGLAGSSFVLTGAAAACAEHTWPLRIPPIRSFGFLGGIAVATMALAGQNMPWIDVSVGDFRWVLAVDAVPGLGDLISLVLLFVAGSALVSAVTKWVPPALATVVSGFVLMGIAVAGVASGAVVERAGTEIARRVTDIEPGVNPDVDALLIAPGWFALTGVCAICVGVLSLARRRRAEMALAIGER